MKVGVIGCGFFAQNHLAAWQAIKEVNLVAVCDQQRKLAEAAKTRFRAHQAYNEAEEMHKKAISGNIYILYYININIIYYIYIYILLLYLNYN